MIITRRTLILVTGLVSFFTPLLFSMEERGQTDLAQAEIMIQRIQESLDYPHMLDQAALDRIGNDLKLLKETTYSPNRIMIIKQLQKDFNRLKNKRADLLIPLIPQMVLNESEAPSVVQSVQELDPSTQAIRVTQSLPLSISHKFLLGFNRYHANNDIRLLAALVLLVPAAMLALKMSLGFVTPELTQDILVAEDSLQGGGSVLLSSAQDISFGTEGLPAVTKACSSKPKDVFSKINTVDEEQDLVRFAGFFGAGGLAASVLLKYVFGK